MKLEVFIKFLNEEFPQESALEKDRIGLQIKSNVTEISSVLFAYEITEDVIDEAEKYKAGLIVTFHPLIYSPLISLSDEERVGKLVMKLIKSEISLFTVHTNFDKHAFGTNKIIADKIGLKNQKNIENNENNGGLGLIGELEETVNNSVFAEKLSYIFNSPVKFCIGKTENINKVAVIGGSGSSFLENVIRNDADAFVTADVSYHTFHSAKGRINLFETGHYEMEQFNHFVMADIISNKYDINEVKIFKSKKVTNPVNYYPEYNYKENQLKCILNN